MVAEGNLLPGDSVIPPQEERIVLGETVPDADERTETTSTSTPVSEETRLEMETGAELTKVTSETADTQTQIKRVVEKSEQPEMASADTLTVEDPTALVGNDDNDSRSVSVTILLWATIFVALGVSAAILVKIFTICREESRSTYQDDDEDDGTTATKASSNTTRTDDNQDTTELSLLEDGADDALRILEIPTRHCADSCWSFGLRIPASGSAWYGKLRSIEPLNQWLMMLPIVFRQLGGAAVLFYARIANNHQRKR
jgi:hypothetical protein